MTSAAAANPLSASVLVLNRFYMAVHVINVRRAFGLLFRELAEVIHLQEGQYANYSFESWREISELKASFKEPHDDWVRSVNFEIQVPRVIRLLAFDRVPKQTIRFNRRNLFAHQRAEPGPRDPQEPQRPDLLGKHRLQLRLVQRPQRGPHSAGSPHASDPPAGQAEAQPALGHQAGQSEIRKLEKLFGPRLLVGGLEVGFGFWITATGWFAVHCPNDCSR